MHAFQRRGVIVAPVERASREYRKRARRKWHGRLAHAAPAALNLPVRRMTDRHGPEKHGRDARATFAITREAPVPRIAVRFRQVFSLGSKSHARVSTE